MYVSGRQGLYVFRVNETNDDLERIAYIPIGSGSSKMLRTNANAFVSAHASHEIVAIHSFMENVHIIARNVTGLFELWKTFSFPNESILQFRFIDGCADGDVSDRDVMTMMQSDDHVQRDVYHRAVVITTSTEYENANQKRCLGSIMIGILS